MVRTTDADMDGYVSAACCNGGPCGDDCAASVGDSDGFLVRLPN